MPRPKSDMQVKAEEARAIRDGEVRKVNAAFNRAIPKEAIGAGVYEVPDEQRKAAPKLPVKNGRYRITGHDWIHEFRDGRWFASYKARPDLDPKGIIEIA